MNKNLIAKLAILALLFAAFAAYNLYNRWQDTHFAIDPKSFHLEKDFQAVLKDQEKINPLLAIAYQFDLPKSINQTETFPNLKRKVTIHKMWYAPPYLYVMYSVNLHKDDRSPADVPKLQFSNVIFHSDQNKAVKANALLSLNLRSAHPITATSAVYNGELYRGIMIRPQFKGEDQAITKLYNHLKQIDLTDLSLIVPKKGKLKLKNIQTLTYPYQPGDNDLFQVKLNKSIQLGDGVYIKFSKWKATVTSDELYFTTNQPDKLPNFFYVKSSLHDAFIKRFGVNVPKQNQVLITKLKEHTYSLRLLPIQPDLDHVSLTFLKTETYGKGVKLSIPSTAEIGDKLGEAYGGNFYYEGIKKLSSLQDQLSIQWDNSLWENKPSTNHLGLFNVVTTNELQEMKQRFPKDLQLESYTTGLSIYNEKGKQPKELRVTDIAVNKRYKKLGILLNHSFVEHAKRIIVTLNHLPYTKDIKKQQLTINIPLNGQ